MKYKNKLLIKGEPHHLEALATDLENIGRKLFGVCTHKATHIHIYDDGDYQFTCFNLNGDEYTNLTLPQDWQKALDLASEKKEKRVKYVECVSRNGCNGLSYTDGKIYKLTSDGEIIDNEGDITCHWTKSGSKFKPSTKKAYKAQKAEKPNPEPVEFTLPDGEKVKIAKWIDGAIQITKPNGLAVAISFKDLETIYKEYQKFNQ